MYKVINGRGTGKTKAILERVMDEGADKAVLLCKDPEKVHYKALNYGFYNLDIRGYDELENIPEDKAIYIHNVDEFLSSRIGSNMKGYSMTYEP